MPGKIVATCFLSGGDFAEEKIKRTGAEFLKIPCQTELEILEAARDADVIVTTLTLQPFPKKLIEKLENVRHIASLGVGFENIDLAAATKKLVVVTTTPLYCIDEVSNHAMALILALARKILPMDKAAKILKWRINNPNVCQEILRPMKRLRGQTLGLIGFGNIARSLVPKAKGFGLEIIAVDPSVPKEIMEAHFGVRKVELAELLQEADFVSLHVNLTKQNRKMLEGEHFQLMKRTAYFINTARGGLVDETALIKALQEKWIAGAGLDVMDQEPPQADNPLLKMENVIITGHSAQYSDDSEEEIWGIPLEEARLTLDGKFPNFSVNPEVKTKWLKKWKRPV